MLKSESGILTPVARIFLRGSHDRPQGPKGHLTETTVIRVSFRDSFKRENILVSNTPFDAHYQKIYYH